MTHDAQRTAIHVAHLTWAKNWNIWPENYLKFFNLYTKKWNIWPENKLPGPEFRLCLKTGIPVNGPGKDRTGDEEEQTDTPFKPNSSPGNFPGETSFSPGKRPVWKVGRGKSSLGKGGELHRGTSPPIEVDNFLGEREFHRGNGRFEREAENFPGELLHLSRWITSPGKRPVWKGGGELPRGNYVRGQLSQRLHALSLCMLQICTHARTDIHTP